MARQNIPGKPRESKQNLDLLKHYFSAMKKNVMNIQRSTNIEILANTYKY